MLKSSKAMKKLLGLLIFGMVVVSVARSQEFLLHDETFTWHKDDDICGGYHYWYDRGNGPVNWKTPYDYQNGQYYFRFQVINQPSSEPFTLNMCIWTEYLNGNWKEECVGFSPVLAGPGSLITYNSPITYQLNGIPIDWTDLTKLWRMGNPLYIGGHNLGNGSHCTDHPELWDLVDSYLPLTMRVTVVAVADGYSFSGWDNYLGGNPTEKQPTPNYGIDYASEHTNKVIPSTDEYSYSSDMAGAVSGNGQYLLLTPGVDVYFRTKAGNGLLESDIQHLVVPLRQSMPSFTVDYINESTVESAGSEIGYSTSPSFSDPVNGTGGKISLTPGQDLYLWKNATSSAFASFDYHLVVPNRPAAPAIAIDYFSEVTSAISTAMEYSISSSMTSPISGNNSAVQVTPGTDLYIRAKATAGTFASAVQNLNVPDRPAAPTFAIDFANEKTVQDISSDVAYSTSSSFTNPIDGAGNKISLTPGQDLYLWTKATSNDFASFDQHLVVPLRPAMPAYSIDFINESTAEEVPSDDEYAFSADMSDAQSGAGTTLTLFSGSDYYFRVKYTLSSFTSEVFHLTVPERPVINSAVGDTIEEDFFTATVDFHGPATGFEAGDVNTTNADVTLTDPLTIKVIPVATGEVTAKISANAIAEGNYISEILTTYYNKIISSIPDPSEVKGSLLVFPSPVEKLLNIETTKSLVLPVEISLLNMNGAIILQKKMLSSKTSIDFSNLHASMYILKVFDARGKVVICKIMKQ